MLCLITKSITICFVIQFFCILVIVVVVVIVAVVVFVFAIVVCRSSSLDLIPIQNLIVNRFILNFICCEKRLVQLNLFLGPFVF